jgi:hypothetical protein
MNRQNVGIPFLTVGIAFVALGAAGRRAFLAIGLAFIALGLVMLIRHRRRR